MFFVCVVMYLVESVQHNSQTDKSLSALDKRISTLEEKVNQIDKFIKKEIS